MNNKEILQSTIREKRNNLLLSQVDKVQKVLYWEDLTDLKKEEWRKYRKALLDLPLQKEFEDDPINIIFPVSPDGEKTDIKELLVSLEKYSPVTIETKPAPTENELQEELQQGDAQTNEVENGEQ